MTIDAQKLAANIVEWGKQIAEAKREYAQPDNTACDAPELYSMMCWGEDIIRQLIHIVKVQESCLHYFQDDSCSCGERFLCAQCDIRKALALSAPLVKEGK